MVQDNANKPNQVAARIYLPQEDPMLPVKTLWFEADHWVTLYAQLDQEVGRQSYRFCTDGYIHPVERQPAPGEGLDLKWEYIPHERRHEPSYFIVRIYPPLVQRHAGG